MTRLRLLAATLAACATLVAPAAAHAELTVSTGTDQAGAAAQVTIHATFATDPAGGPVVVHLPAGLVGNPGPFAQCTENEFQANDCPDGSDSRGDSRVGTASATTPLPANGAVYNMAPQGDEPARLGIIVTGAFLFSARNEASVKVRSDGGLDSTIADLQTALGQQIESLDLTLNSDFITMPTSCGTKTVTMEAAGTTQSDQFNVTNCGAVPFKPGASIQVANSQRTQPTGATATLTVPDGGTPHQSHVKTAVVTLPKGTTLNPGVANGLQACSSAQFAAGNCPAASKIGSVSFATPLLKDPLGGSVFFGQPADGKYPLLVAVDDHGVHLKLTGTVTLDPNTGQITTVFDDLPQVPFTSFSLTFQGGDRAVLANPPSCGPKAMQATLTPWSGNAARTATGSYTVTGCQPTTPFRPTLAVASDSTKAGRPAGALSITIARPDGDQDFGAVETALPPGLAGTLTGVPMCPELQANAGTCPAATRLGSVSAVVGSGGAPVGLNGTVYLTGPAVGGLAGMAIVIPSKVGPVDLGTVVVRAGLLLRPDGGVTVRTAPLPPLVGGVPVSVRSLTLRLDRPGFAINPSGCDTRNVTATLTGSEGTTATVNAPYAATDCGSLPFKPKLTASIDRRGPKKARTSPGLRTSIRIPAGQSSTQRAAVKLPKRLTIDTSRIKKVCTSEQAAADACPAKSQVGTVKATTPLLPIGFSGPVHLVQVPGQLLPGLRLSLNGPASLRLTGALEFGHGVTAVFDGIPDVPLSRFDLAFVPGGPLKLLGHACSGSTLKFQGTFAGHNGTTAKSPAKATVRNCPAVATLKVSNGHKPRGQVKVGHGRDAKRLKRVVVHLPKGMSLHQHGRVRVTRDGHHKVSRKHVKITRHTVTLKLHKVRRATIELRRGALRGRPHGRAKVQLVRTNGKRYVVRPQAARLR